MLAMLHACWTSSAIFCVPRAPSLLPRSQQLLKLGVATDEPGQPTLGCGVEPTPERPLPKQLVCVDRPLSSLHCDRPERSPLESAGRESVRRLSRSDRARWRHLLETSR